MSMFLYEKVLVFLNVNLTYIKGNSIVGFLLLVFFFSCSHIQLNRAEFEDQDDEARVQYEGFRPGMYVRIEIENVPCEFVLNFDPHYPMILGGLGNSEGNVGYVQVGTLCCMLRQLGFLGHTSTTDLIEISSPLRCV